MKYLHFYIKLIFCWLIISMATTNADEVLAVEEVAKDVYAIVGPFENRSPQNLGNNATFGVIVTSDGVVLIDSGGSEKGAEQIAGAIKKLTQLPVKIVINTGGQDHRWLGNEYFKKRGALIIASDQAVADQKARTEVQLNMLGNLIGNENLEGTIPVYADKTFTTETELSLGGVRMKIIHAGGAHTPGDSFVWLADRRIVFSGDIVYTGRMLGINSYSQSKSWVDVFEKLAAYDPQWIIPGHGPASTLQKATNDSYDYLVFVRQAVQSFMDDGGGIENVGAIDQSRFSYLENFGQLKGRNAQKVYEELEWE